MTTKEIKVATKNANLDQDIEVTLNVSVPETLEEAAEFYGGQDKLIESVQGDVARRRANAARPALRDAETVQDWQTLAQGIADGYKPGERRGGFGVAPTIEQSALDNVTSTEDLIALLRAKGINIA